MGFYIKCEKTLGRLSTVALALFSSLWTICIFVVNMRRNMHVGLNYETVPYEYDTILKTIQYEYLIIVVICTIAMYWGIRRNRTAYLMPWACLKVCECVVLAGGIPFMFSTQMMPFQGLIPFGLISLVLNVYTGLCVYRAYRKIKMRLLFESHVNEISGDMDTAAPPSYEVAIHPEMAGREINAQEDLTAKLKEETKRPAQLPAVHVHQTTLNTETNSS